MEPIFKKRILGENLHDSLPALSCMGSDGQELHFEDVRSCKNWQECLWREEVGRFWRRRTRNYSNYQCSVHNQLDRSHVLAIKGTNICVELDNATTCGSIYICGRGGVPGGG